MKGLKILAVILLLATVFSCLFACTKDEEPVYPEKPSYQSVIDNTNKESNITIDSDANVKFVFYESDGTPCRINESLNLNRSTDGNNQYVYLEASTSEISSFVQDIVTAVVSLMEMNGNEKPLVAIQDYLFGRKYIALRAGKAGDNVNAQVQLLENGVAPDFIYSDDGQEIVDIEAGWGAARYSDILEFQESASVDFLRDFDVIGTLFDVINIPFDWSKATDNLDSKPVEYNGQQLVSYELSFPSNEIVAFIKKEAEFFLQEFFGDDQEKYDRFKGYYDRHIDTLFGMINIGNYKQVAYIDAKNRLVHSETSWQITLKVDFNTVINVLRAEGVAEENLNNILSGLNVINTMFIGASDKQKGKFEFGLVFDVKEDYSYGNTTIDTSSSLYTDFDADEPGRYTIKYGYDEEKERMRWIPVNVPSKLQESIDKANEPEEPEIADGEESDSQSGSGEDSTDTSIEEELPSE